MKRNGFSLIELMIVVGIISILTAVTVPAYQIYVKRVRIANALSIAAAAQTAVAETTTVNNALPATQAETAYISPQPTRDFSSIVIANDGTGTITITLSADLGGDTITLVPLLSATGNLTWDCKGGTLAAQYRPLMCRP